jgi:hypothetical protein
MKKQIARTGLALFLLFVFVNGAFAGAATAHRITFAPGNTSATEEGWLQGQHDKQWYVVRVLAHQHMKIHVESEKLTNPQIDVIFPNGHHMDRDMQGTRFETDSTHAGDYRIEVYEGLKGDPGRGKFKLWVEVV